MNRLGASHDLDLSGTYRSGTIRCSRCHLGLWPRVRLENGEVVHLVGESWKLCEDQQRATDAEIADKIRDEKQYY